MTTSSICAVIAMQKKVDSLTKDKRENLGELIDAVTEVFFEYDPELLNQIYDHYYSNMTEVLKCQGDNEYRAPHHHIRVLRRQGLPTNNVGIERFEIQRLKAVLRNFDARGVAR